MGPREIGLNEPVNLGSPDEMTILEFAKKILKMTGNKNKIVFKSLPENDPKVRRKVGAKNRLRQRLDANYGIFHENKEREKREVAELLVMGLFLKYLRVVHSRQTDNARIRFS